MDLPKLSDNELVGLYPQLLTELKHRKIIRTNNLIGDLGEYWAIKKYTETAGLPKLQAAPPSTRNVDALSILGQRYAVKSTSTNQTGVFHSLSKSSIDFEYLIVVRFNSAYELESIYECSWDVFIKHRKIKNPEKKFSVSLTKSFLRDSKNIYQR